MRNLKIFNLRQSIAMSNAYILRLRPASRFRLSSLITGDRFLCCRRNFTAIEGETVIDRGSISTRTASCAERR